MPKVNFQHPSYTAMLGKWLRCREVASGTDAVKDSTAEYLPRVKDQDQDGYDRFKARAVFYNATWRTIAGLVGMMFRKPPKLEVAESIKELLKNVDGAGKPFQLFLQGVSTEGLELGRIGVLVDYPTADPNITRADAKPLKLKPTMQMYRAESIINWRLSMVNNEQVPTLVVLEEQKDVPSQEDEFVTSSETQWRVLDLFNGRYRQRVYRQKKGEGGVNATTEQAIDFEMVGSEKFPLRSNKPLDFIPFVVMGVEDVSFKVEDPPLIDLVDMNLSHYRTSAIYEQCVAFCPPTMWLTGWKKDNPDDKIYVGSDMALVSSSDTAKVGYAEYTGSALAPLEKSLDRKETQMAVLGARMLEPQKKAVESSDTHSIHRKGEESLLSSMAQAISLGMTKALKWFIEWSDQPTQASSALVELNRDFYPRPMDPAMLTALISGWQQGAPGLSDQGLFAQLQAGEIVGEDVELEDEQARITERQMQLQQQFGTPDPDGTATASGAANNTGAISGSVTA